VSWNSHTYSSPTALNFPFRTPQITHNCKHTQKIIAEWLEQVSSFETKLDDFQTLFLLSFSVVSTNIPKEYHPPPTPRSDEAFGAGLGVSWGERSVDFLE